MIRFYENCNYYTYSCHSPPPNPLVLMHGGHTNAGGGMPPTSRAVNILRWKEIHWGFQTDQIELMPIANTNLNVLCRYIINIIK